MKTRALRARMAVVARSVARECLRGLQLGFLVMFKPAEGFAEIQTKTRFLHAVVPVLLYFVADAAGLYLTGFPFQTQDPSQVNLPLELVRVLVPWSTWCVAHFAIESIFFGEGTFQQIVVASAACLTPQMFFAPLTILLSSVLTLEERGTYYFVVGLAAGWTFLLFFLQVRFLNDFSWKRTGLTTFLILFATLVIWVTGVLVYVLTGQLTSFGRDVWYEFRTFR